jgi:glycosyltransferase involved in cell wall biosynthesis
MEEVLRKYIVVTPCRNEEKNLPNLIQSMVAQTIKPVLWVIIDDGSTDGTPEIIKESVKKHNWIQSIRLDSSKRDLGVHYADIVKKGFDFAIEYCAKNEIEYWYLGNLDGDLTLPSTFYENLMIEFEKDPELGIASGGTEHIVGDRVIHANLRIDEPSGGHMLIRKRCFEECGGIPLSYSCDSVLKAKARLKRWKTKRFENNIATEIRDVSSAEGYWKGFVHSGKESHHLNLHPIHVIIRSVMYSFKRPWYTGIAYLAGYLSSVIRREKQINEEEIRRYFWNKWKNVVRLKFKGCQQ